ncbi:MAG: hypothetical protein WDZ40_01785 [Candidatus Spechtbacterales bacterium]
MRVIKCDKCEKEADTNIGLFDLSLYELIPSKSVKGVQLCKDCSKPYLSQLSKDNLIELKE